VLGGVLGALRPLGKKKKKKKKKEFGRCGIGGGKKGLYTWCPKLWEQRVGAEKKRGGGAGSCELVAKKNWKKGEAMPRDVMEREGEKGLRKNQKQERPNKRAKDRKKTLFNEDQKRKRKKRRQGRISKN